MPQRPPAVPLTPPDDTGEFARPHNFAPAHVGPQQLARMTAGSRSESGASAVLVPENDNSKLL